MKHHLLGEYHIANHLRVWVQSNHRHHIIVPNVYLFSWESDLISVSRRDIVHEYEIKTSRRDYKNDGKKTRRHQTLASGTDRFNQGLKTHCPNYFWYVAPKNVLEGGTFPEYAGLIEILLYDHSMGFSVVKKAPQLHRDHLDPDGVYRMLVSMSYKYWDFRGRV